MARAALAIVLALVAVACGDGDDEGGGADVTSGPTTTVTSTTMPATTTTTTRATGTTAPRATCSATGTAAPGPQQGLPAAVAATRTAIVDAARACDYERLSSLARAGGTTFTYSFGGGDDPAAFWRNAEADGQPVMRSLVQLLGAPFATRPGDGSQQYVWPSAFSYERWEDVPEADRQALRPVYGDEDLRRFAQFGSYAGLRVGILADGDWIFYVGGD